MKRTVIAVILIGFAFFLSVFGYFDLKTNCKKLTDSFEKAAVSYQSNENGNQELKKCLEFWNKHKTSFEIYINHDELDEIQMKTKELEQYLSGKRDVKVDELCFDCINKLEHIIDAETPSLGEVF